MKLARTLLALGLFGIAFGYVEAAVVVYLRTICAPIRDATFHAAPNDDLFPLLQVEQLQAAGPQYVRLLWTELGRELATLVMLAAAGLAIGRSFREWLAGFMIAFGVWDIFYYVSLKLLLGWPASLGTWDILFLLPVPWVGPVIAPVLVSLSMIAAGAVVLRRESRGRPVRCGRLDWTLIVLGGPVVIAAFCWDFLNTAAGGWPNPFHWPLFALGEAMAVAGFVHALGRRGDFPSQRPADPRRVLEPLSPSPPFTGRPETIPRRRVGYVCRLPPETACPQVATPPCWLRRPSPGRISRSLGRAGVEECDFGRSNRWSG